MVRIVLLGAGLFFSMSACAAQEEVQQEAAAPAQDTADQDKQFDFDQFLKELNKLEAETQEGAH